MDINLDTDSGNGKQQVRVTRAMRRAMQTASQIELTMAKYDLTKHDVMVSMCWDAIRQLKENKIPFDLNRKNMRNTKVSIGYYGYLNDKLERGLNA